MQMYATRVTGRTHSSYFGSSWNSLTFFYWDAWHMCIHTISTAVTMFYNHSVTISIIAISFGCAFRSIPAVRIALLCFTLPLVLQQTTMGLFTKVFKRVNGSARGLLGSKLRTNITLPHFIGQMKLQRKPRLKGWRKRLYLLMMGDAAARPRGGKRNFIIKVRKW